MKRSLPRRPKLPERTHIDISRRHVLQGLGGAALALPFMPSLLRAQVGDPVFSRPKRLFWLTSDHGGAFETNMFPSTSLLTESSSLFSDHPIASGALSATMEGDDAVLSPVLRAPASVLTSSLVAKMNVLYGLDVPFYIAHNTGLHLGNYARNDGNGGDGAAVQAFPRPTIDQIMAWSPSFYPDLASIRERAMVMGMSRVSWNYSDPAAQSGSIDHVRGYESSLALFDAVFVPPDTNEPQRTPIVDRVLESYRRLRDGNRRLSAADRQRLEDHMARVAELERKLGAVASCGDVSRPDDDADRHLDGNTEMDAIEYAKLFTDVAVTAFMCGTSRIGVLGLGGTERFVEYGGDWHQEVAHQWQTPEQQDRLVASYQRLFQRVFLDLAAQLDVEEAPGVTYLDNSLLAWSQESGMETHGSISIPVVTFGSAAGFFRTGQFIDYRRSGDPDSMFDPGGGGQQYLGVLYNQWLATVLQAMGVPPAEFERWGHKGYGVPFLSAESWTPPYVRHYESTDSRYFQMASDILPLLGA